MSHDHTHEERIRLRAYQIWLSEGRPHGRDQAHWQMARDAVGREDIDKHILDPNPDDPKPARKPRATKPAAEKAPAKASKKK